MVIVADNSSNIYVHHLNEDYHLGDAKIFKVSNKLQTIKNNRNQLEFFCLFKDSPIQIYDINGKQVWKAKNLPHDELDLKVNMWDTDVVQLKSNPNHFYVSTAYGEV